MLEVRDLTVRYGGALALDGVNLQVAEGEIVAVIGPNGAGKSTLLRAVSGLVPWTGSIRFRGAELRGSSPDSIVRRGLVHCPEGGELFREMTVEENLELGAYTVADPERRRRALEGVFRLFPRLQERRRQLASTLSGGERQMLAIGRALMAEPKLLMLDEPSHGLAPVMRQRIAEAVVEVQRQWGISVLLVEQDTA
ncbi:MAG TPA: ABC transporter ATP-binding protein, partial [Limnochordales bacterium]